ncbi:MAG: membrane protein insertase YidC, partial [Treponemataceae bacterium]|nr:membrane protein insertase YidC [Treponemataceae bacterium]
MDKNTITAVVLIFLVLIGYTIVQAKFFPPPQPQQVEQTQIDENVAEENSAQTSQFSEEINSIVYANSSEDSAGANENLVEKKYTITTDKIKVVFTNRGGDIVSYELLDHKDTKTGFGVEMADNISASNRAFSLAFGGAENSIVNDLF